MQSEDPQLTSAFVKAYSAGIRGDRWPQTYRHAGSATVSNAGAELPTTDGVLGAGCGPTVTQRLADAGGKSDFAAWKAVNVVGGDPRGSKDAHRGHLIGTQDFATPDSAFATQVLALADDGTGTGHLHTSEVIFDAHVTGRRAATAELGTGVGSVNNEVTPDIEVGTDSSLLGPAIGNLGSISECLSTANVVQGAGGGVSTDSVLGAGFSATEDVTAVADGVFGSGGPVTHRVTTGVSSEVVANGVFGATDRAAHARKFFRCHPAAPQLMRQASCGAAGEGQVQRHHACRSASERAASTAAVDAAGGGGVSADRRAEVVVGRVEASDSVEGVAGDVAVAIDGDDGLSCGALAVGAVVEAPGPEVGGSFHIAVSAGAGVAAVVDRLFVAHDGGGGLGCGAAAVGVVVEAPGPGGRSYCWQSCLHWSRWCAWRALCGRRWHRSESRSRHRRGCCRRSR